MEFRMDEPILARYYLVAKENGIDLKYLCLPEITISSDYLKALPYVNETEELNLKSLCNMSFNYHFHRTVHKMAHKKVDREIRLEERDNDPFYWLSICIESQNQLRMWLGRYYKDNGVVKIDPKKSKTVSGYLKTIDDALTGFKQAADKLEHMSYKEVPNVIAIKYPKIIEHTEASLQTENKYRAFCEKYGIDFSLVADVRVFSRHGKEYDPNGYTQSQIKLADNEEKRLKKQWHDSLDIYGRVGAEPDKKEYIDYRDSRKNNAKGGFFFYYRKFLKHRADARTLITRCINAELNGELTPEQIREKIQSSEAIYLTDAYYRELVMSRDYFICFAMSGRKEIEQVNYYSGEVEKEMPAIEPQVITEEKETPDIEPQVTTEEKETTVEEQKISTEDVLLDLYKQAQELLNDIENAKREKYLIEGRRKQIAELREKLEQEEKQLLASEQGMETQISELEQKHSDLTEEIQIKKEIR